MGSVGAKPGYIEPSQCVRSRVLSPAAVATLTACHSLNLGLSKEIHVVDQ